MILSEFLGEATVGGDGKSYAAYFSNLLAKQYHAYLRCTYYISYANFGVCLEEDLWETTQNIKSILTPRETEIFNLMLEGLSQNQIMKKLNIKKPTYFKHFSKIKEKIKKSR